MLFWQSKKREAAASRYSLYPYLCLPPIYPNRMSTPQPSSIEENEIILGTGMGPLRFGATMDEVRTLVGEPV